MYNPFKQKYINGLPISKSFTNLSYMLVTFILDKDIFAKVAVKHMLTNLKIDSRINWSDLVNDEITSPKSSVFILQCVIKIFVQNSCQ